jgi:hypothetical protein
MQRVYPFLADDGQELPTLNSTISSAIAVAIPGGFSIGVERSSYPQIIYVYTDIELGPSERAAIRSIIPGISGGGA